MFIFITSNRRIIALKEKKNTSFSGQEIGALLHLKKKLFIFRRSDRRVIALKEKTGHLGQVLDA